MDALLASIDALQRHQLLRVMVKIVMIFANRTAFITEGNTDEARMAYWLKCLEGEPGILTQWLLPFATVVHINWLQFGTDNEPLRTQVKGYLKRLFILLLDGVFNFTVVPMVMQKEAYNEEAEYVKVWRFIETI